MKKMEKRKEVLSFTLLYTEFDDAVKEVGGSRVLSCWKLLLLLLASRRTSYSIYRSLEFVTTHASSNPLNSKVHLHSLMFLQYFLMKIAIYCWSHLAKNCVFAFN